MNALFLIGYIGVTFLLLKILVKDELFLKLTLKRRILSFIACLIVPTLFFMPYIFEFVPANIQAPGWIYWFPFLLIALIGTVTQLFFPSKVRRLTPILIIGTFSVILLLNLMPIILSVLSKIYGWC